MRDLRRTVGLVAALSVTFLLMMAGLGVAAASPGNSGAAEVSLEPANQTVTPGEEASYEVVVEGATNGIGAYIMTLELENTSAATVTGFDHHHDPMFDNTAVYDDRVEVSTAMGNNIIDGADEVTLGTVTVAGEEGSTDITFENSTDGVSLADESDDTYNITDVAGGTLAVNVPAVDVGLTPVEQTLSAGSTTSYDLVVDGAVEGISAYTMSIELSNSTAATIEGFEHASDPQFDNTEVTDTAVNVSAAMGDNTIASGEDLVLGTLTVSGETPGTTDLVFDTGDIGIGADDQSVSSYAVDSVTDGSLEVTEADPVTVELVPLGPAAVGEVELGVVVTNASNGIGAYNINMTAPSQAVAFTDHELTAEGNTGPLDDSELSDDGSSFSLTAALLGAVHEPATEIQIATVTVTVDDYGSYEFAVGDAVIDGTDSNGYDVVTGIDTTLSVESPPPVNGGDPPQDLTGNGLFEDIDGDGSLSIFDVQILFDNLGDPAIENHASAYSFNEGDTETVTIFDVQTLFSLLGTDI